MTRRASIDRFEGELAVLAVDGREVQVPRSALPEAAREGDVVDPDTLELDREATDALRSEVAAARAALKRDPGGAL